MLPLNDAGMWSGLLCGALFGFVLENAGFGSPCKLTAQFRLSDWSVFKVMFTAIVVAAVGLWGLRVAGLMPDDALFVPTSFVAAAAVGGALVGVGFAVGGYCPGTSVVGLFSGRLDAMVFVIGLLLGTVVFAGLYGPAIEKLPAMGEVAAGDTFSAAFGFPDVALLALLTAAQAVVAIQARYAAAGIGLAHAALAGAGTVRTLRHYPEGDVIDRGKRSQFHYHAHGSRRRPVDEHGHFHLFMRPAAGPDPAGGFFHLAALPLDDQGWPLRWFCTNRWVTGEQWVPADTVIAALPGVAPVTAGRLAPVAAWLGAMVLLYADALAAMLRRREAMLARRLRAVDAETLFEDRRLDVVTETQVSLPRRLHQLAGPV